MGKEEIERVEVLGEYPIEKVEEVKIEEKLNEHATAYVVGLLKEEESSKFPAYARRKDRIKIVERKGGKEEVLFCGLVQTMEVSQLGGVAKVKIEAKSGTIALEYQKKSRSFQKEKGTYEELFYQIIRGEYGGDVKLEERIRNQRQEHLLLQYQETDWEFLKRAAKERGSYLIPEITSEKARIWVGVPSLERRKGKEEEGDIFYQKYGKEGKERGIE